MPNVSELARREEELANAVARVNNLRLGKESREAALREVRVLERELGVEAIGNINSAQGEQDEVLVASAPAVTGLTRNQQGIIINALRMANDNAGALPELTAQRDEIIALLSGN